MVSTHIIIMTCVMVFLMSVYSWLNFLKMEHVEHIRGLSQYVTGDADRILGYKSFKIIFRDHIRETSGSHPVKIETQSK